MCTRSLTPSLLGLGLALGACDNDPTQPNASPTPAGPELAVGSGSWITRANMPVNRRDPAMGRPGAATAVLGGKLYVMGGKR
jgi:hypothetical protein